jgi:hypothetical protein
VGEVGPDRVAAEGKKMAGLLPASLHDGQDRFDELASLRALPAER